MVDKINIIKEELSQNQPNNIQQLEEFRIYFLGKKGVIQNLFTDFKSVEPEKRKEIGILLNELKKSAETKYEELKGLLTNEKTKSLLHDLTMPSSYSELGSRHPISIVRNEIIRIFERAGFVVNEGPEIEDDWHNFTALNFPPEHPARDMQDTFFVEKSGERGDIALRTHTSSVQVRIMEKNQPPIRSLFPGRVFRNEAISARAHCIFHQVEGLYIDKKVSFADLKQILLYFAKEIFGMNTKIRLRPSYFPFTEPSAEMDISCSICGGTGCNICKYTGWVEILGCGMVDPNVLENCSIDSKIFTGYAFGMGIERITMLKYGIKDLRLFFENDIRFLRQFEGVF